MLQAYVAYFNQARPHQGLEQALPIAPATTLPAEARNGQIKAVPVLGGLHHDYHQAA